MLGKWFSYYHVNTQGAPVAATDQQGEIKWRQEYANFGYHTESTGQINDLNETSFGLAGHVEDQYDDLLLVYMQARYYDPLMGRFLSIDAAGFDEANPQSFNRYSYANNNPHRYVDPDGNIIFLAPFAYTFATFVAKEVAIAVVSHYVPAVQYLGTKNLVKEGVEATGKLFVRKNKGSFVPNSGLGDLTAAEVKQLQNVADKAGRPLEVVGSAASGTRRGVGTNLPIGKGTGTRSDIDVLVGPASRKHFDSLESQIPSLDPKSGIITGTHNPYIGPGVRFEPGATPKFVPSAGGG